MLAVLMVPVTGWGQGPATSTAVSPVFQWRVRAEQWSYFTAPDADHDYGFLGSTLRFGLQQRTPGFSWRLEAEAPVLLGLPDDAVASGSRGALGLGATYYAANRRERNVAHLFLKQAFARIGAAPTANGHAIRVGRFEFSEGLEIASPNASVMSLKRSRIAERLIGPFAWTHVGRSFDGLHYTWDRRGSARQGPVNVTLAAFAPTEGAFRVHGWRPLEVGVGYGALSFGSASSGGGATDARLFGIYYDDRRTDDARINKVDNRPAAVRSRDRDPLRLATIGGHLIHVAPTTAGDFDLLAWGALQAGDWGTQSHRAGAAAVELGWQPAGIPGRPWLRGVWFRSSGDEDAEDDEHTTFFEILPTPRPYARFPIHNLMNLDQVGGSLTLRPTSRLSLRSDVHSLRLSQRNDLWYAGGGAYEQESFGFAGRPSSGARALSLLTDLSADYRLTERVMLSGYVARATAGDVIRRVHPGSGPAVFGYVEFDIRY